MSSRILSCLAAALAVMLTGCPSNQIPGAQPVASEGPAPVAAAKPVKDATTGLPYGQRVDGKPDWAISPYAVNRAPFNVSGLPKGTEIACPYTSKTFLLP